MKKTITRILLILGILLVLAGIVYVCYGVYKKLTIDIPNPVATIEVEDYGTIKVELYPDKAPNTVANFIRLANRGFYNGTTFHRTMPDFVIQGGAKNGDATVSPALGDLMDNIKDSKDEWVKDLYDKDTTDEELQNLLSTSYNIPGEFIANGYNNNNIKHEEGVISMARSDYSAYGYLEEGYNSAGCQFFIMTADNTQLDGAYAAFGKVTEGMDVVKEISNVEVYYRDADLEEGEEAPTDEDGNQISSDTPKEQPVMTSVSVETYGVDYGIPETVQPFDLSSIYSQLMGY